MCRQCGVDAGMQRLDAIDLKERVECTERSVKDTPGHSCKRDFLWQGALDDSSIK